MKSYLALAALLVGCGGDPANVEGTWTVSGTNREDGCAIGWTVGESFTNVQVMITQNDEAVIVDVRGGGGGLFLDLLLGGNDVFRGSVDGNKLEALREGTRPMTMGNCTYTFNAHLSLVFDGDVTSGRIDYRSAHNGNSDCAAVICTSSQDLNGTRPPQ